MQRTQLRAGPAATTPAFRRTTHSRVRRLTAAAVRAWPALAGYALVRLVNLVLIELSTDRPLHDLLATRFDSGWYLGIAESGYTQNCALQGEMCRYAFFPLYPGLIRGISGIIPLSPVTIAWAIALLFSLVAAWGIFAVVEHLADRRAAIITAVLWGIVPHAVVQSMAYTESLFTALAAWALYAVLTKKWLSATALAVLAGLTRPTGAAVVAAVALCALWALLRPGPDGERPVPRLLTALLVSPMGLVAWFGWVGHRAGRWDGYFRVQERWSTRFDFGVFTYGRIVDVFTVKGAGTLTALVITTTLCGAVTLLIICALQRQPAPLLIYAAVVLVVALGGSEYFHSKARLLIPAFVLIIPVAKALARSRPPVIGTILTAGTLVSGAYGSYVVLVATTSP
ncbi:glycosyltransferase family 39 protein [Streptomyces sp. NPDC051018]|uniref:glycosyltransferase family 39 protein n=1 Tax=Streptomyces sp. NPDC051018 TaxID=3365639 RepID=UPI00379A1EAE